MWVKVIRGLGRAFIVCLCLGGISRPTACQTCVLKSSVTSSERDLEEWQGGDTPTMNLVPAPEPIILLKELLVKLAQWASLRYSIVLVVT